MADTAKKQPVEQVAQKRNKDVRDYVFAVGRRRESVARARLYTTLKEGMSWGTLEIKKGDIVVNEKPISQYFASQTMRMMYSEPFRVANAQNKYTVTIRVVGGGPMGQLNATIAAISNALAKADEENFRPPLKKKGFLTRDSRVRQRRMVGTGGKSRRQKQSPKR